MFVTALITTAHVTRFADFRGSAYNVSWSSRGVTINGAPQLLLSGDVHYARGLAAEQDRALDSLVADSLNVVQTYVFWSLHEPSPSASCFGEQSDPEVCGWAGTSSRANLTRFLDAAAERGLWVSLRIGPFVCGEWSYGGIPAWINDEPGMAIRTSNAAWERAVSAFVRTLWAVVEPYTARRGGPIILLQIENEAGAANLDAILDVEDVDFVFLGPTDLSAAMGEGADLPPG